MDGAAVGHAPAATVLITGAAGNMGTLIARHLVARTPRLRLMYHRTPLAEDLTSSPHVKPVRADLGDPGTLPGAVQGVDVIVHLAGVLFAPRPERFLPITNTKWFSNLLDAALAAGVGRIVLASFPQVEGPTTVDDPATGRLDREPISAHAKTRLEEERLLMSRTIGTGTTPVVLRFGVVYGRGLLLVEAARRLARRGLLCVWNEPTILQLIAAPDCVRAADAAVNKAGIHGIYHVGDEKPVTVQEFLDGACDVWGFRRPRRVPMWAVKASAALCEDVAALIGTGTPLTRDLIRLGRVPHWGDTKRTRLELLPELLYPRFDSGRSIL